MRTKRDLQKLGHLSLLNTFPLYERRAMIFTHANYSTKKGNMERNAICFCFAGKYRPAKDP
jgi:hypothetical protein